MMKAIALDYQGLAVMATREAWFNATQVCELHSKRIDNFFSSKKTQLYINTLDKRDNPNPLNYRDLKKPFDIKNYPNLIKTKRGNNGGTWLHPDLMIVFARFISIEFEIWCDKTIKDLMINNQTWQPARQQAKQGYKLLSNVIHDYHEAIGKQTNPYHYANEARMINELILGKWGRSDRESLDSNQLKLIDTIERKNAVYYMMGKPYAERKQLLASMLHQRLGVM